MVQWAWMEGRIKRAALAASVACIAATAFLNPLEPAPAAVGQAVSFTKSTLVGTSSKRVTSLQFGPDGRLTSGSRTAGAPAGGTGADGVDPRGAPGHRRRRVLRHGRVPGRDRGPAAAPLDASLPPRPRALRLASPAMGSRAGDSRLGRSRSREAEDRTPVLEARSNVEQERSGPKRTRSGW